MPDKCKINMKTLNFAYGEDGNAASNAIASPRTRNKGPVSTRQPQPQLQSQTTLSNAIKNQTKLDLTIQSARVLQSFGLGNASSRDEVTGKSKKEGQRIGLRKAVSVPKIQPLVNLSRAQIKFAAFYNASEGRRDKDKAVSQEMYTRITEEMQRVKERQNVSIQERQQLAEQALSLSLHASKYAEQAVADAQELKKQHRMQQMTHQQHKSRRIKEQSKRDKAAAAREGYSDASAISISGKPMGYSASHPAFSFSTDGTGATTDDGYGYEYVDGIDQESEPVLSSPDRVHGLDGGGSFITGIEDDNDYEYATNAMDMTDDDSGDSDGTPNGVGGIDNGDEVEDVRLMGKALEEIERVRQRLLIRAASGLANNGDDDGTSQSGAIKYSSSPRAVVDAVRSCRHNHNSFVMKEKIQPLPVERDIDVGVGIDAVGISEGAASQSVVEDVQDFLEDLARPLSGGVSPRYPYTSAKHTTTNASVADAGANINSSPNSRVLKNGCQLEDNVRGSSGVRDSHAHQQLKRIHERHRSRSPSPLRETFTPLSNTGTGKHFFATGSRSKRVEEDDEEVDGRNLNKEESDDKEDESLFVVRTRLSSNANEPSASACTIEHSGSGQRRSMFALNPFGRTAASNKCGNLDVPCPKPVPRMVASTTSSMYSSVHKHQVDVPANAVTVSETDTPKDPNRNINDSSSPRNNEQSRYKAKRRQMTAEDEQGIEGSSQRDGPTSTSSNHGSRFNDHGMRRIEAMLRHQSPETFNLNRSGSMVGFPVSNSAGTTSCNIGRQARNNYHNYLIFRSMEGIQESEVLHSPSLTESVDISNKSSHIHPPQIEAYTPRAAFRERKGSIRDPSPDRLRMLDGLRHTLDKLHDSLSLTASNNSCMFADVHAPLPQGLVQSDSDVNFVRAKTADTETSSRMRGGGIRECADASATQTSNSSPNHPLHDMSQMQRSMARVSTAPTPHYTVSTPTRVNRDDVSDGDLRSHEDVLSPYIEKSPRRRDTDKDKEKENKGKTRQTNPILAMTKAARFASATTTGNEMDASAVGLGSSTSALELAAAAGDAVGRLMADMASEYECDLTPHNKYTNAGSLL